MRYFKIAIIIVIAIIALMLCFMFPYPLHAQELPEPTTPVLNYDFEIAWGTKTNLVWTVITPASLTIVAGTVSTTHSYYGIIGANKFEFETPNSTVTNPEKGIVIFNIGGIPSNKFHDYFRVHVRASCVFSGQTITSAWSDPSYYVQIVDIKKLNQPVSIR